MVLFYLRKNNRKLKELLFFISLNTPRGFPYTYKILRILEALLNIGAFCANELPEELKSSTISLKVIERLEETYCAYPRSKIINNQTLQDLRKIFCHSRVLEKLYQMLESPLS